MAIVVASALAASCGGDPPLAPEEASPNLMSALIEGEPWAAGPLTVIAGASTPGRPGSLTFQGTSTSGEPRAMAITLARVPGPGTNPLRMNMISATGGTATFADASRSWITPPSGSAGSITITTITESRVTGSFSFSAVPFLSSAGSSVLVTAGAIDVPLSAGFVPATSQQLGGRVSMNLQGYPILWNTASTTAPRVSTNGTFDIPLP